MKRLFVDIETSPDIGFFWRTGYKLNIQPEAIIKERAIICVCYKWEDKPTIHALSWNNGDDNELLKKFAEVSDKADEFIGHNLDRFDLPWINSRRLINGMPPANPCKTVDTLKIARKHFYLNSNRLDYLGKLLLNEGKIRTEFDLWKDITLNNDKLAMKKMVKYCKKDVDILQRVWEKLVIYDTQATHAGVLAGLPKWTCPHCASEDVIVSKTKATPKGTVQKQMYCKKCGHYYTVSLSAWKDYVLAKTGEEV